MRIWSGDRDERTVPDRGHLVCADDGAVDRLHNGDGGQFGDLLGHRQRGLGLVAHGVRGRDGQRVVSHGQGHLAAERAGFLDNGPEGLAGVAVGRDLDAGQGRARIDGGAFDGDDVVGCGSLGRSVDGQRNNKKSILVTAVS